MWNDDRPCYPPSIAAQTNDDLCREHCIYPAIGHHPHIPRCFGLVHDGDDTGGAIARKLDPAPKDKYVHSIKDNASRPFVRQRLAMAAAVWT
ncbi:hypothetical protein ACHAO5_002681 [Verticillium nonalfalfae]